MYEYKGSISDVEIKKNLKGHINYDSKIFEGTKFRRALSHIPNIFPLYKSVF